MATFDLRNSDPLDVHKYDVVGECGPAHVRHVALALEEQLAVQSGQKLHTVHMAPPLLDDRSVCVHVLGRLGVDPAQELLIRDWLDHHTKNLAKVPPFRQYYILRDDAVDSPSGQPARQRYSCASFVHACFHDGLDVELVDQAALPLSDKATLQRIWSERMVRMGRHHGLEGEGPWPILLPAHILHALDREDPRESPYRPRDDDWDFPRR